jgi:hypothetical protein
MRFPASLVTRALAPMVALATLVAGAGCGGGPGPELDAVPDQVAQVGQEIRIELVATDPSGVHLEYGFHAEIPDLDGHASMTRAPNGAGVFRWTPLASDVGTWYIDFTASNGSQTATTTARVEVKGAVGKASAPVFVEPLGSGTTLDLAQKTCLDLDVVVRDQDSTEVTIAQGAPAIDGATLASTGGLTATWHWCPSEAQIVAADRYTLELTADDGTNPKTVVDYLVVLRRKPAMGCAGTGPVVTHTAADASTAAAITVKADITDDKGLAAPPLVYYTTTAPATPPDLGAMTQLTMHLDTGDMITGTWTVDVPNPTAGLGAGATSPLYYVIVAEDADDPSGPCDHTTQAPATGAYHITVTNPGPTACVDDIFEDDDHASIANPTIQPTDAYTDMVICSMDDDWYKLRLHDGDHLVVDLTFQQTTEDTDLDLHLFKGATTDLTPCTEEDPTTCDFNNGQSTHSNEHLEWDVAAGSGCTSGCNYYVIVHGFAGASNTYSIGFSVQ